MYHVKRLLLSVMALMLMPVTTTAQNVDPTAHSAIPLTLPSKIEQVKAFNKQFDIKQVTIQGFEKTHEDEVGPTGGALSVDASSAVKLDPLEEKPLKNWVQYVIKTSKDWGASRGRSLSTGKIVSIKAARLDRTHLGKTLGVLELRMLAMTEGKPIDFHGQPEHIVWAGVLELKPNGQVEKILTQYIGLANIDHDGINDYSIIGVGKREQDEVSQHLIQHQGYYSRTQILLNLKTFTEVRYDL